MTARPQDVALLPLPKAFADWLAEHCEDAQDAQDVTDFVEHYARANLSAALASAQAREEELRAEVEFHKLDAGALRVQMDVLRDGLDVQRRNAQTALTWFEDERGRAERLAEALRDKADDWCRQADGNSEVGFSEAAEIGRRCAAELLEALTTNAAQPGETTWARS